MKVFFKNQITSILSRFLLCHFLLFFHLTQSQARENLNVDWHFKLATSLNDISNPNELSLENGWVLLDLPHSYNLPEEYGNDKEAIAWYVKKMLIPENYKDRDIFLEFEGVCLRARIFINGHHSGSQDLAYLPFKVDITPHSVPGETATVAVAIDNRLRNHDFPDSHCNGWWIYGGITRDIYLTLKPKNRIEDIELRTEFIDKDSFNLIFSCTALRQKPDSLILSIHHPTKNQFYATTKPFLGSRLNFVARLGKIRPWTPDDPFLYEIRITPYFKGIPGETAFYKKGFSQLTTQSTSLLLNGKPIYLRGIGRHDVLGTKGPLLTRKERLKDLLDLKAMGANMLRIAHFPQHRDVYEICDSLGILVMDEIPAWKTRTYFLAQDTGKALAKIYMDALIKEHGNYTCIGIWSVGNELTSYRGKVADYIGFIADHTRKSDPTRLVTYCSYFYQFDKSYHHLDIISVNEYFGWYIGSLDMLSPMLKKIHEEWPEKPIMITEFGAQAGWGTRNPNPKLANALLSSVTKDVSEDHQALYLKSHMDTIWSNRKFCQGLVVWSYNDFMTRSKKPRPRNSMAGMNCMGVVDHNRNKKLAYYTVKETFASFENVFGKTAQAEPVNYKEASKPKKAGIFKYLWPF